MQNNAVNDILKTARILDDEGNETEVIDLAGYQVTRAELFSHVREPAITIWESRIKFNMACLRRFPGVTHIQVLIHPEQKRLIIRPCQPDAPDALRWAKGGGEKELQNRDLLCRIFAAKVFDLMGWDKSYRYKILNCFYAANASEALIFPVIGVITLACRLNSMKNPIKLTLQKVILLQTKFRRFER